MLKMQPIRIFVLVVVVLFCITSKIFVLKYLNQLGQWSCFMS